MKIILLSIFSCISILVNAQYYYTYNSSPDSAAIYINGKYKCHSPCKTKFFWNEAIDDKIVIELKAPGFEVYKDSLTTRPKRIPKYINITMKPALPKIEFDSNSAMVVFDRFISAVENNSTIGFEKTIKGDAEEIIFKESSMPDEEKFAKKFYSYLLEAKIENPFTENNTLFSDPDKNFKRLPRYVVGVKLNKLTNNVSERFRYNKYLQYGNAVGETAMELEWQIFDKSIGKVMLTKTTNASFRYRQGMYYHVSNIMPAFELGIAELFNDSEFIEMVRKNDDKISSVEMEGDSSITKYQINKPELPSFTNFSGMIQHASKACVTIITDGGHGSGVIISESGLVLSALHVVDGVNKIQVKFSSGLKLDAKIIAKDYKNDVVLLDITGEGFQALPINNSGSNNLGMNVVTIGTPADLELGQSIAKGILSGKRKIEEKIYLQTDMAVSPGNSGGPLLNEQGEIIGIIQRKIIDDGVEGIGFAIPVSKAIEVLNIELNN